MLRHTDFLLRTGLDKVILQHHTDLSPPTVQIRDSVLIFTDPRLSPVPTMLPLIDPDPSPLARLMQAEIDHKAWIEDSFVFQEASPRAALGKFWPRSPR